MSTAALSRDGRNELQRTVSDQGPTRENPTQDVSSSEVSSVEWKAFQSPSLAHDRWDRRAACEMKFLLEEETARQVEAMLRPQLRLDPHIESHCGDGYHLRTLYCDTPSLAVLHRVGRYRLFKFRLRQYGHAPRLFLERKSKHGDAVRKRRTIVPLDQLKYFVEGSPGRDWEGNWFYRHVQRNRFAPVCLLEYQRMAYCGSSREGPLRLTFDRRIHGGLTDQWSLDSPPSSQQLLAGQVVCEFKFRGSLPSPFKMVIEALKLAPRGVSKYRHCLNAAGLGVSHRGGPCQNG